MAERDEAKKPRFPRRKWRPGQQERIETPKKGRGAYRRQRQRKETDQQVGEWEEQIGQEPPGQDEEAGDGEGA